MSSGIWTTHNNVFRYLENTMLYTIFIIVVLWAFSVININIPTCIWSSFYTFIPGPSWSWFNGSWIYNYLCNQCLSPLTLWVQILLRRGVLYTTLYEKNCQWLAAGQWFSPGTQVSSINKTDRHNITEILLKVALNTITPLSKCN